jgi:hypothetical protein
MYTLYIVYLCYTYVLHRCSLSTDPNDQARPHHPHPTEPARFHRSGYYLNSPPPPLLGFPSMMEPSVLPHMNHHPPRVRRCQIPLRPCSPLCPTATTLELLFLIIFSVHAAIIDDDLVCAAILESIINRTIRDPTTPPPS